MVIQVPDSTTRSQRKARTRSLIVREARRLFAENGIMATTTADVARAVGLSHGAVFVHFRTRDDLIASVICDFGSAIVRSVHDRTAAGNGVRDVLRSHLDAIAEDEAFYSRLVTEAPLLPAQAREELIGIQSAVSLHLQAAASREAADGRIRQIPPHLLFNTWIGLVHHYLVNRDLFSPGGSVIALRGDELLEHYLNLLSTSGSEES